MTAVPDRGIAGYLGDIGLPTLLFRLLSLTAGFVVPRAPGVVHRQAIASALEVGVHNGTLAITVAISVLAARPAA